MKVPFNRGWCKMQETMQTMKKMKTIQKRMQVTNDVYLYGVC